MVPRMKAHGPGFGWAVQHHGGGYSAMARQLDTTQGHLSNVAAERRGVTPKLLVDVADKCRVPLSLLTRNRDFADAELIEFLVATGNRRHLLDLVGEEKTDELLRAEAVA
jgi:hypothetical protein